MKDPSFDRVSCLQEPSSKWCSMERPRQRSLSAPESPREPFSVPCCFDIHQRPHKQVWISACLFADACLLYRTINSDDDASALQEGPDQVQPWGRERDWQMKFNPDKCEVICISNKRSHPHQLQDTQPNSPPDQLSQMPGRHHRQLPILDSSCGCSHKESH